MEVVEFLYFVTVVMGLATSRLPCAAGLESTPCRYSAITGIWEKYLRARVCLCFTVRMKTTP